MDQEGLLEEGGRDKSVGQRIEALKSKHAALETALEEECRRPMPDETTIKMLKRQKLAIKDEIARLSRATDS